LGAFREWIDQILIADQTAPRKQRHTAKRIADRLAEEHGVVVAGSTMRDHVRKRRRELGLAAEAFCEQVHDPGVTAEVDWGEATVSLAGVLTVLGLFLMRSCFSGACFVMAFELQCQQAFFEGHVHALDWFSGVFTTIRYDNLAAAAKKTLKGRNRVENERFTALRSHYLYESWFTLVGIQGAHEKGGVENEVGRFRRNHLVPIPEVADLAELNDRLLACCIRDLDRTIAGRSETVGARLSQEIEMLPAAPGQRVPDVGAEHAPRQPEVDDHRASQPLLGPGPAGRHEGLSPGRGSRDRGAHRRADRACLGVRAHRRAAGLLGSRRGAGCQSMRTPSIRPTGLGTPPELATT